MKIYHNNRCSKSRACLALMPAEGTEIVDYIKNPLTAEEISALLLKLGIPPVQLIRQGEAIWKEKYKGRKMTDQEYILAMSEHPNLIERPIVETEDAAIICRPPELVFKFMK